MVDVTTQPITTVASGRWTSAPTPVLNAMGTKPRLATSPVINTGRRRVTAAWRTAVPNSTPLASRSRKPGRAGSTRRFRASLAFPGG